MGGFVYSHHSEHTQARLRWAVAVALRGASEPQNLWEPGQQQEERTPSRDDGGRKTTGRPAVRVATTARGGEGDDGGEIFLHAAGLLFLLDSGTTWTVNTLPGLRLAHLTDATFPNRTWLWSCDKAHPETTGRLC